MSFVTDRQRAYITSLIQERIGVISAMPDDERAKLLAQPTTSSEASVLIGRLKVLARDKVAPSDDQTAKADALRARLGSLTDKDRSFGQSLLDQFDQRGSLSDRQWFFVEKLASTPVVVPEEPIEPGLYKVDGNIVKVYLTQTGRLACKKLFVLGNGRGSFRYVSGLLVKVRPEHRLTEAEAQEFGKQYSLCCACARTLDDERSLAVGYGPVCADHYGWYYPNYEEASKILNRPTVV